MERRVINPWKWQDNFGFVQANEVTGAQRTLIDPARLRSTRTVRQCTPEIWRRR